MNHAVSIVLVTYNSERVLSDCLNSLSGMISDSAAEIMVVDNASTDLTVSVADHSGASVIANPVNLGFAAAANQGVRATAGEFVLLLNPDTVLVAGFDRLVAALENDPQAGAAAGVLIDHATRKPQQGFSVRRFPAFWSLSFEVLGINWLWPGNPVNRRYRCLDLDLSKPQEIDQPAGACILVRRAVWERFRGLDERFYPLWFEDVDFCLRISRAGLKILLEPACQLLHEGGHSLEKIGFTERQLYWYGNMFYYVRKNIGSAPALGIRVLVCIGAGVRMFAAMVAGRFGQTGAYVAAIRLAIRGNEASKIE